MDKEFTAFIQVMLLFLACICIVIISADFVTNIDNLCDSFLSHISPIAAWPPYRLVGLSKYVGGSTVLRTDLASPTTSYGSRRAIPGAVRVPNLSRGRDLQQIGREKVHKVSKSTTFCIILLPLPPLFLF